MCESTRHIQLVKLVTFKEDEWNSIFGHKLQWVVGVINDIVIVILADIKFCVHLGRGIIK